APFHTRDFIISLQESNKKLFNEILSNDLLNFYYMLSHSLLNLRGFSENKFYFLFDIHNQEKVATLFPLKPDQLNSEKFHEILHQQFSGEIYRIFGIR